MDTAQTPCSSHLLQGGAGVSQGLSQAPDLTFHLMHERCGENQEHSRIDRDPYKNTQLLLDLWAKANLGLVPHWEMLISGTQDDNSDEKGFSEKFDGTWMDLLKLLVTYRLVDSCLEVDSWGGRQGLKWETRKTPGHEGRRNVDAELLVVSCVTQNKSYVSDSWCIKWGRDSLLL